MYMLFFRYKYYVIPAIIHVLHVPVLYITLKYNRPDTVGTGVNDVIVVVGWCNKCRGGWVGGGSGGGCACHLIPDD